MSQLRLPSGALLAVLSAWALVPACARASDLLFVLGGDDPNESAFVSEVGRQLDTLRDSGSDRIATVSASTFRSGYALAKGDRQVAFGEVRTRGHIGTSSSKPLTAPPATAEPPSAIDLLASDRALLVPVGETALKAVLDAEASEAALSLLVTRDGFDSLTAAAGARDTAHPLTAIVVDQPIERQIALAAHALPRAKRLGLLYPPSARWQIADARAAAARWHLQLIVKPLEAGANLTATLAPVIAGSDVLLVLRDPASNTAGASQALLQAAARNGRPVVAASEAFLRAGALVSVYTTREQFARHAAEDILRFERGTRLALNEGPRYFTVRHNDAVAQSLGIPLADDATLEAELAGEPGQGQGQGQGQVR